VGGSSIICQFQANKLLEVATCVDVRGLTFIAIGTIQNNIFAEMPLSVRRAVTALIVLCCVFVSVHIFK
jgi:hypothetical protein